MVRKIYLYCRIALAGAGAIFLLAATLVCLVTSSTELKFRQVVTHLDSTLTNTDANLSKLGQIEDNINTAAKNVATASGDWSNSTKAQIRSLNEITTDVRTTLVKINRFVGRGDILIDTTNDQLRHVGPLLDSLKTTSDSVPNAINKVSDSTNQVMVDVHNQLTDATTKKFMDGLAGTSANLNTETDLIQRKTREIFYPAPCTGKLCKWKTIYHVAKDINDLGEPSYFTYEFLQAMRLVK